MSFSDLYFEMITRFSIENVSGRQLSWDKIKLPYVLVVLVGPSTGLMSQSNY